MRYEEVREQARTILKSGSTTAAMEAESLMRRYLSLPEVVRRERGLALAYIGELQMMRGANAEAGAQFEEALSLVDSPADKLLVLAGYTGLVYACNHRHTALQLIPQLYAVLSSEETKDYAPWGYGSIAKLARLVGDNAMALRASRRAVETTRQHPTNAGWAEAYYELSMALEVAGDYEGAVEAIEISMARMTGAHCLMNARARHSKLLMKTGDVVSAYKSLCKAVELPDMRDRRIIASVLRAIVEYGQVDAQAALRLNLELASHLECSSTAAD